MQYWIHAFPGAYVRYLVMFSNAFPMFPLILLLYNWVETKLDIYEYTLTINRAPKEKVVFGLYDLLLHALAYIPVYFFIPI